MSLRVAVFVLAAVLFPYGPATHARAGRAAREVSGRGLIPVVAAANTAVAAAAPAQLKPLVDCWPPAVVVKVDGDADGIVDSCEKTLAEKFAPVVYHSSAERNFPVNVDWFLSKTSLWFYDDECDLLEGGDLHDLIKAAPTQAELISYSYSEGCGATDTVHSNGTRSIKKQRTFYLNDVADADKKGSLDSRDWTTYFHAYRNNRGGVTLQYWRVYAADSGKDPILHTFGGHGGDWEGMHVVLDDCLRPVEARLMGHTGIELILWTGMTVEGTHPLIFSEVGGHASHKEGREIEAVGCVIPGPVPVPDPLNCKVDPANPITFVRQETWTGGRVRWPDGTLTQAGRLLNVGEKTLPLNNQLFIQYSGIWGSPGLLYATSGYWGPAYNETEMTADFFITAWCGGGAAGTPPQECHPRATSR